MPAATCCRSSSQRDRTFVGTTSFKVVVDPQLTPSGQVIIYAALSGTNGGIWRSVDTGKTWQLMLAGQATDVVLDPTSGTVLDPTTGTNVQGNLQIVYAGIRGEGVFISPNQGQGWNLMAGGIGNPLILDLRTSTNVNPAARPDPQRRPGPDRPGQARPDRATPCQDQIYAGLALRRGRHPRRRSRALLTKDFGQNWTKVRIPTLPQVPGIPFNQAIATNDVGQPDYPILGGNRDFRRPGQLRHRLAVDPTNPNIVYLGGSSRTARPG